MQTDYLITKEDCETECAINLAITKLVTFGLSIALGAIIGALWMRGAIIDSCNYDIKECQTELSTMAKDLQRLSGGRK